MDIRWKNKAIFAGWLLLFTFGLSGLFSVLLNGSNYLTRDYFQSQKFDHQLNQFTNYLGMFELNYLSPAAAKQQLTATAEEIDEHRHRYGDLGTQITDIKSQYEDKIQDAKEAGNKELVTIYVSERDKKIEDITNNFKSDEYVRVKVIKEKEQKLDEYYRELEEYRAEFTNLKAGFKYYLRDTVTGEVFTNLTVSNGAEAEKTLNSQTMLFTRKYPTLKDGYLTTSDKYIRFSNEEIVEPLKRTKVFEGTIAVPKLPPTANYVTGSYYDYQEKQRILIVYLLASAGALLLSLYIYKKTTLLQLSAIDKLQVHYNRMPIDISIVCFVCSSLITLLLLASNIDDYLYAFIMDTIFKIIITAIFVAFTVTQGKLLYERVKGWSCLKLEWENSLTNKVLCTINNAFLNRSMGTQLVLLLAVVFAFGLGAAVVVADPKYILFYGPLFMVVGIPTLMVIFKRADYFNRIVNYTSALTKGEMGADLPLVGKSSLATLASNLNTLKQGVTVSQREQAKSERLKTELITNVSHDLRTPLTSIITYTELLKTPELSNEERESYIEIIDRKSKRLKVLIDDLFEASKMASGSIELVKEKVDIVQLLQQALAEHNEAISESTLQFRVNIPDKPLYAIVDGQKLWRVFDNLIGNILKYSLESTRVYLSIKALPGKANIVFKNITKYELGENIDELLERFKRGDTSRNTEGSGLGLAIAKSIMDLHGGDLDIEVDGDLFKITVTLATV